MKPRTWRPAIAGLGAAAVWLVLAPAVAGQATGSGQSSSNSGGSQSGGGSHGSSGGGSQSGGGSHASGGGPSGGGGGHASSGGGDRGGSGGGHVSGGAVSHSGGGSSHSSSGGGRYSSSNAPHSQAGGRDTGSRGAVRGPDRPTANASANTGAIAGGNRAIGRDFPAPRGASDVVPAYSRPSNGAPIVGIAVPRPPGSVTPPIVLPPGGWYPWWIGGGYGGYYGGSYLWGADPWFGGWGAADWDPYEIYGASAGGGSSDDEGALHIKVKPSTATVYVDGYYVGLVDDFDGLFQKLHLQPGSHRIEIRAPGYDTLTFDVHIEPNQTMTYKGEMKKSGE